MLISIITVTYNSELYLEDTILSVLNQDYNDIEYIIIDGGSTDNTLSIIDKYKDNIDIFISEPDKGIYDAMNKGIKASNGDIIGFLNSDDIFMNSTVISSITKEFNIDIDCIIGDVVYVRPNDLNTFIRRYSSKFKTFYFKFGHMPAHPSFYAKRELYKIVGSYNISFKISADFDFLLRALYVHRANYRYLNIIFVKMRIGGVSSSFKNKLLLNKEILRSCRINNLRSNYLFIYGKYLVKIFSFF